MSTSLVRPRASRATQYHADDFAFLQLCNRGRETGQQDSERSGTATEGEGHGSLDAYKRGRLAWPSNTAMHQLKTSRLFSVKSGNRDSSWTGPVVVAAIVCNLVATLGPMDAIKPFFANVSIKLTMRWSILSSPWRKDQSSDEAN